MHLHFCNKVLNKNIFLIFRNPDCDDEMVDSMQL